MDTIKRKTKKFTFANPDLTGLRELGSKVPKPEVFQRQYGKLLNLPKVRIEKGCLPTLVQFYDPLYHCFTFPDFQLAPTLEEYSSLIGLPILNQVPYHGLEPMPTPLDIAKALHLEVSAIDNNFIAKDNLLGLPIKFLFQKAFAAAEARNYDTFYPVLALLIYGLILFPNPDHIIDIHAIKIFLSNNPVPTLLADTYHYIHDRTLNGRGAILCCAPLLYEWFVLHLPQTPSFLKAHANLPWSHTIMSLTPSDVVWSCLVREVKEIIIRCGEYANVPLIGRLGGITYNPILARRQFGYPVKAIPDNITLDAEFYLNTSDSSNQRERFIQAWHDIQKLQRNQLGPKSDSVCSSYVQWIIDRAFSYGMPYDMTRAVSSTTPASGLPPSLDTEEEYLQIIAKLTRERDTWERKYLTSEDKIGTLEVTVEQLRHQIAAQEKESRKDKERIYQQDRLLRQDPKRKRAEMSMFESLQADSD